MKSKEIKKALKIIEEKRLSIIIIFLIIFIPPVVFLWTRLFPQNPIVTISITIVITLICIWAICLEVQFRKALKDKTRLISYLKRHGPYHSFGHIHKAIGLAEKRTKKLISLFPEELNDVPMQKHGPGVGINKNNN